MEKEIPIQGAYNGSLQLKYFSAINYSLVQNGIEHCTICTIKNQGSEDWENLRITYEGNSIQSGEINIARLAAGETAEEEINLDLNLEELLHLEEAKETSLEIALYIGNECAVKHPFKLHIMAYDQWLGTSCIPETIASFVTPSSSLIEPIKLEAARFLQKWSKESAITGYLTKNPNQVRRQVAAIYEALRSLGIVYSVSPTSFEVLGQRIRLPYKVMQIKIGNCIELSLLMASCLEACGIRPFIVFLAGHAMVGAWLSDEVQSPLISDDLSFLLKGCVSGVNDLVVLEATAISSSQNVGFEDAVDHAISTLHDGGSFEFFVDIFRCRLNNILPLPTYNNQGEVVIDYVGIKHKHSTHFLYNLEHYTVDPNAASLQNLTRQQVWERKLLDTTLRNNLINLSFGKRTIPLLSIRIDLWEDKLQAGKYFDILPHPQVENLAPILLADLESNKLYADLSEGEVNVRLKELYRASRTALEENGANALFIAFGVMEWYETPESTKPRFAPLLLVPIDMVRSGRGYRIRMRDEGPILNTTLVELLKQNFSLHMPELDPLPQDQFGVDVVKTLSLARAYIRQKTRWNVHENALIGYFSFNKFVMWNDIHSNSELLAEHPIVKGLLQNHLEAHEETPPIDARSVDKSVAPQHYALPVEVDSSQLEAVVNSGLGKSFILHGPPGTGKSQTITNMIANALYQGKRVLFVAEKMAALSVVQRRLEKIGLAPFCLELHSNKATKTHFLEQLQKTLELVQIQSPQEYEETATQLFSRRKELIRHIESLHKTRGNGYSLYNAIVAFSENPSEPLEIPSEVVTTLNKAQLENWQAALIRLDAVLSVSGHPAHHPLKQLILNEAAAENLPLVRQTLSEYSATLSSLESCIVHFEGLTYLPTQTSFLGVTALALLAEAMQGIRYYSADLAQIVQESHKLQALRFALNHGEKTQELAQNLQKEYSPQVLSLNANELQEEWKGIQAKWLLPRLFATKSFLRKMRVYRSDFEEQHIPLLVNQLSQYREELSASQLFTTPLEPIFGTIGHEKAEDWAAMQQASESAERLYQALLSYAPALGLETSSVLSLANTQLVPLLSHTSTELSSLLGEIVSLYTKAKELRPHVDAFFVQERITTAPLSQEIHEMEQYLLHYNEIKDWALWCRERQRLSSLGLGFAIEALEADESLNGQRLAEKVTKGAFKQLAEDIIDQEESLRHFSGAIFEDSIKNYKQLSREFQELTQKELYCRLAHPIAKLSGAAGSSSEVGILKRNIGNHGRGTSIRKIIDQIPHLLPRLCPCMLMSPLSVAQYIDLKGEKFDLVIFDEASQMPTSEAVGAIARGKSLVVVGDPKQMPPTSFFARNQVDDEEAEVDDMESILDDCIALSLPSRYLTWHYRSKHESLIAFSNRHYYEGKLYTFPSVDDKTSKVQFIPIEGVYARGTTRSNEKEARAVVEEVVRRLRSNEEKSLGIIAFSQVQQNLIEDLLTEQLYKDPALEEKAFHSTEPIFIKNLENVQGDERDVILFSVGYGPDKEGKVSLNFGPLNKRGGERRLNVAVSRARYEMMIFSSLRPEQIDLNRTKAEGVIGLKRFLEFAGGSSLPICNQTENALHTPSPLLAQLAQKLRERGYTVNLQIGRSGFRIDLAIVHPQFPDKYILGILSDGAGYYATKTTRDREIVQPSVLSMLHWHIMRVWTVDLFEHPERVLTRIEERIQSILSGSEEEQAIQSLKSPLSKQIITLPKEEIIPWNHSREIPYQSAEMTPPNGSLSLDTLLQSGSIVYQELRNIIEVEQPICLTLLYKRIAQIWGIQVSGRMQKMIQQLLSNGFFLDPRSSENEYVYWLNETSLESYITYRVGSEREITDIPTPEIANAMHAILEQHMAMPQEELKRMTGKTLGFARMGSRIDEAGDRALKLLLAQGKATCNGTTISLS